MLMFEGCEELDPPSLRHHERAGPGSLRAGWLTLLLAQLKYLGEEALHLVGAAGELALEIGAWESCPYYLFPIQWCGQV